MEVVTGAMSTLLPKLGNLIKDEYDLQRRVRGEIMFLTAELERMEAALLEVSEAPIDQPPSKLVKLWAKDVKDLSYEIEDSIDKFMVRLDSREPKNSHSFMGFIDRSIALLTKAKIRHKIGTEVKDIKSRIKEVSELRDRYKIDNVVSKPIGTTIDSLRQLALYRKATELIGIEEKSKDLVKMLKEEDELSKKQLKIVSIVGFGGLGKTTLANVVQQKLKVGFDVRAFVSVSLNPNMEKIFKSLLHQFGETSNINDDDQLIMKLRKFLEHKRYFIVIDDIWDKSVWEKIKCTLIENGCGSRVIATTRILDVAKRIGGVYQLKHLSIVDSRKLFYQRIFGSEDKCPPNQLAKLSENILKKCGGVPLAIITIASMLANINGNQNTHKYWSKVYHSMGSGLDESSDMNDMRRILSVSYYDLPPHLKTCLLYLSLYPEDYEIERKQLIWKWVGEGFVKKEQGKSLYEVGEDYFDELIDKSLIIPADIDIDNKVSSCHLHDMVLDLITSLSTEENFLTTLGGQQHVSTTSKIRRLSMQTSKEEDVKQLSTMTLSHVRSLTVFNHVYVPHSRSHTVFEHVFNMLPALSCFPVLRVLDLRCGWQVENYHFKEICKFLHLRYLRVVGIYITEIPKEIGNLKFLQVLDTRETGIRGELPSTFVQLTQLMLLDMLNITLYAVPRWMSALSSLSSLCIRLETLGEEDLRVFGSIPSLGDLYIWAEKPTQGRDESLVIDRGHPFWRLTRFTISCYTIELVFAQGAMQKLETLGLHVRNKRGIMYRFGDTDLGLKNLSSLEHVFVNIEHYNIRILKNVGNEFQKAVDMNPNNPTLKLRGTCRIRDKFRVAIQVVRTVQRLRCVLAWSNQIKQIFKTITVADSEEES